MYKIRFIKNYDDMSDVSLTKALCDNNFVIIGTWPSREYGSDQETVTERWMNDALGCYIDVCFNFDRENILPDTNLYKVPHTKTPNDIYCYTSDDGYIPFEELADKMPKSVQELFLYHYDLFAK